MAFLLNKSISSPFRSQSHLQMKTQHDAALPIPRRGFHVEPGLREQALLAEDPALKRYKSHKKGMQILKRYGDVLMIVVVAGSCYEIYVRAITREQSRKQHEKVQN